MPGELASSVTKDYLKQHWLWLALPFVLVVAALATACLTLDAAGSSPFLYQIH
jgi:hypothetical protein